MGLVPVSVGNNTKKKRMEFNILNKVPYIFSPAKKRKSQRGTGINKEKYKVFNRKIHLFVGEEGHGPHPPAFGFSTGFVLRVHSCLCKGDYIQSQD